jgi:excisionase family DNA binding protein
MLLGMADERLLSLSEVAERLHVTRARVRQLIDQDALHARRVGRQLVVEEDALRSVIRTRRAGRPVSPELAWGIALAADSIRAEWLSPVQRSRAMGVLRTSSPVEVRAKLARRAEIARYHASERGLRLVEAHRESRPAGHSLADKIAIDLIVPGVIERYISRSEIHELVRLSPLLPNLSGPNVILHVLADDLWRKVRALKQIPPLAAASDLIEVGFLLDDDRWQRAGWDLLEHSWPQRAA